MCDSARIWTQPRAYARAFGARVDLEAFATLFRDREQGAPVQVPRGLDRAFLEDDGAGTATIRDAIRGWSERCGFELERRLFAERQHLAEAERRLLQLDGSRAARERVRAAMQRIVQLRGELAGLGHVRPLDGDEQVFPGWYAPVLVHEAGRLVVRPMHFGCGPTTRKCGRDRPPSLLHDARRNRLCDVWQVPFGHAHAILVADAFCVATEPFDGDGRILQFTPRDREPMLVACLWSCEEGAATPQAFAAITDEAEPEVAAAGSARMPVNLKPEHAEAWLDPAGRSVACLQAILDDCRRPHYEPKRAA